MTIHFADINYLAVLVAGLVTFVLGGLWYTALFGKLWLRLNGYSEEKKREMQLRRPSALFFGGMVLCYLVLALVLAVLVTGFRVDSAATGALFGFLLWLGPAAAIAMTGHLASDKPLGVYGIDVGFQLIYLVLMGALLGGWH